MSDTSNYAEIAIARPILGNLTYAIPAELVGRLALGHVVLVPFGPRGAETGYVVGFLQEPSIAPERIRPIVRCVDPIPAFDERQLKFFQWIADYYFAPLGEVIRTALPNEVSARRIAVLEPTEEGQTALTSGAAVDVQAAVLRELLKKPGRTRKGIVRSLDDQLDAAEIERAIDVLIRKQWLSWLEKEQRETRSMIKTIALTGALSELLPRLSSTARKQRAILTWLDGKQEIELDQLNADLGATSGPTVRILAERGLVRLGEKENLGASEIPEFLGAVRAPQLNADQQAALLAITKPEADDCFLLWGVTGSGKTEVFLGAAQSALAQGKQVLVLVPEIGLTPQLVGRFRARFGSQVAVLHSGLTGTQRLTEWRRLRAREASVVVGARSALFAPFRDLGLLVVDEEHDDSYKQDDGVRYHARDLAVVLGREFRCPVVLASATPSLESWYNARQGRYRLLRLPNRATPRPVPHVEIVDLTAEVAPSNGPRPLFHPTVVAALHEVFAGDGKAIVLYNRRGFATMVQCESCGGTYECPSCGITMTLHRQIAVVACHYCGLKLSYDGDCPACHKPGLQELGKGTERVEDELKSLFPTVSIGRMDADTTAVRGSHHRILSDFREGKTRLLIGTQIVAKGHDFPDVQVAVVVSADHGFRLPDFRSGERTWAMLVQLAGRAGRGDRAGRVFVQTWNPEHYALQYLDDPEGFYQKELEIRESLRYPPAARLCLLRLEGLDRRVVQQGAGELSRRLRELTERLHDVSVLGPSPAALPKLQGRWRWQIVLRGTQLREFRRFLVAARGIWNAANRQGLKVIADVDPRSLM